MQGGREEQQRKKDFDRVIGGGCDSSVSCNMAEPDIGTDPMTSLITMGDSSSKRKAK